MIAEPRAIGITIGVTVRVTIGINHEVDSKKLGLGGESIY